MSQYPGYYFTGDGGIRDKDGFLWVTGRVDDVLNVSGHRLGKVLQKKKKKQRCIGFCFFLSGTAEIESAIVEHPACVEAACVGIPHEIKG